LTKNTTIFLLIILATSCLFGQTATIKIDRIILGDNVKIFDKIIFQFNSTKILATDTAKNIVVINKGLDSCSAIIGNDTIRFLTKFKSNVEYIIKPGCCCAAFTLQPKNNPRRGTVTYTNITKRDLGLVIAEANFDTIRQNKTQTVFAHESAMCLFKPCSILITEMNYLSDKYDYKDDKRDYDKLWEEQENFVLASCWYHFLHGEKIKVIYNERSKYIDIKLMGYMTDKEYSNIWK
jgi:hypothetical protein